MRKKPNHARRRLGRIAVFLLAGLVVSIGVAWSLEVARAYRARVQSGQMVVPSGVGFVVEQDARGYRIFTRITDYGITAWHLARTSPEVGVQGPHLDSYPEWVEHTEGKPCVGTIAYGFPFRCLKYRMMYSPPSGRQVERSKYDGRWLCEVPSQRMHCGFPLMPIMPGLLGNTLIYAIVLSLPWMPGVVKRFRGRRRVGRGHCPDCNYDLRGEFTKPCSECGKVAA